MGVLDDDEDSFFDADDEGPSIHAEVVEPASQHSRSATVTVGPVSARFSSTGDPSHRRMARRIRMRPMTPGMLRKMPDTVSIFVTKSDGRQCLYVKGK